MNALDYFAAHAPEVPYWFPAPVVPCAPPDLLSYKELWVRDAVSKWREASGGEKKLRISFYLPDDIGEDSYDRLYAECLAVEAAELAQIPGTEEHESRINWARELAWRWHYAAALEAARPPAPLQEFKIERRAMKW